MSLTSAIHIGRTALTSSQIGLQIAGNNVANAATPGYSRQVGRLAPLRGARDYPQVSIGMGVQTLAIERQVDEALVARLWSTTSDQAAADTVLNLYSQVESILGELGDNDLSSELSAFFRSWSERANQTRSDASVIQQGEKLATFMRRIRNDLADQRAQGERQLAGAVEASNAMLDQIAELNRAITDAEISGHPANVLRDQRDQLITELSALLPVSVVDRGREGSDVLVGSVPVVLGGQSRGVRLERVNLDGGGTEVLVSTRTDGSRLEIDSGQVGALLTSRSDVIDATTDKLDTLASQLIWEVNRLHSTGTTPNGYTSMTGALRIGAADQSRPLNDPAHAAMGGLPFRPVNGGFIVRVRQVATGQITERRIDIDLDGLTDAGTPGTADDTSFADIVAGLDAVAGIRATVNASGQLEVRADDGFSFSFGDDSSGALAALGVNTFFSGAGAGDIAIVSRLRSDPGSLAAGRYALNNNSLELVENGTALQLAQLQDRSLPSLGNRSVADLWRDTVQQVGASVAGARSAADAAGLVRESLEAQRQAVSGVSIDEESISLMEFQRQYQGAAKVISTADEMMQELIAII
ncbi:MAG TPA: flagellar hook-associated protein FlgK [Phycisphaerales bacterium]|nr:flagellar hook-associated protein FlgK [Phycisphaerales bacterium]